MALAAVAAMPVRITAFAAALFVGSLLHLRSAFRAANDDEGTLWLWAQHPVSGVKRWGRYTFYIWIVSCLILFTPIDLKVGIAVESAFLFAHMAILLFR